MLLPVLLLDENPVVPFMGVPTDDCVAVLGWHKLIPLDRGFKVCYSRISPFPAFVFIHMKSKHRKGGVMPNGFVKKVKAQGELEFAKILKHGDREIAFRWMREETLRVAEKVLQQNLPRLMTRSVGPVQDLEDLNWLISELARQLKNAPYPDGQVPQIPFPRIPN